MDKNEKIYSVSKISSLIQGLLEQEPMFQNLSVKGEVGTLRPWNYGIVYLNLKEGDFVLPCMLTSGCTSKADFKLKEGMTLTLTGSIVTNAKKGSYYLKATSMSNEDSLGDSLKKLLELKNELKELGMFDPQYKIPIPKAIKKLGVVSSETGAVINDIINVTKRRNPYVEIVLAPCLVSGDGATPSIVRGIKKLEAYGCDVIIVGRGGGSSEDLWVYNNREIAEAAFECSVPIVSAVGHEIDYTILDLVADERAATPSQAAEIAVNDISIVFEQLEHYEERIGKAIHSKILLSKTKLNAYYALIKSKSPQHKIQNTKQRRSILEDRIKSLMQGIILDKRHALNLYIERFKGLSPLEKLNQGYAYAESGGKTLNSINNVSKGDEVNIYIRDGLVKTSVIETKDINYPVSK